MQQEIIYWQGDKVTFVYSSFCLLHHC